MAIAGGARSEARSYPLWDGEESQAEYASRAEIADVDLWLPLGPTVKMRLILIPAGRFIAGGREGHRQITITRPFYMSVTEITQAQYESVMDSNPGRAIRDPDCPVDDVTWHEASQFCERLCRKAGRQVSLPTEAQWEYAYRAGTTTSYFSGDDENSMRDYAWYSANSPFNHGNDARPMKVAGKKPNGWGLYDMAGNLNEWCHDFFDASYYGSGDTVDPTGPKAGKTHVIKGGSVMQLTWIKPEFRRGVAPDYRFGMEASPMIIGFRIVARLDGQDLRDATGQEGEGR